jgi:hypothetical protein
MVDYDLSRHHHPEGAALATLRIGLLVQPPMASGPILRQRRGDPPVRVRRCLLLRRAPLQEPQLANLVVGRPFRLLLVDWCGIACHLVTKAELVLLVCLGSNGNPQWVDRHALQIPLENQDVAQV